MRRLLPTSLALLAAAATAQENFVPILKAPEPAASAPRIQPVTAQRVALAGSMGNQALLVIDGSAPRAVAVGSTLRGVRVLSVGSGQALIEIEGQRQTLFLGAAAVNLGGVASPGSGTQITLSSDANGHFQGNGLINGRSVSFLVDTGATLIAIGQPDADRLQLPYKNGPRVTMRTANGDTVGYRVRLNTVRIGDVEVYDVEAVVHGSPLPFVLLGNSFLTRFQMKRENDTLTLLRRY
jgi:aspartyl protease family protein